MRNHNPFKTPQDCSLPKPIVLRPKELAAVAAGVASVGVSLVSTNVIRAGGYSHWAGAFLTRAKFS
jgi:hypothetical protein